METDLKLFVSDTGSRNYESWTDVVDLVVFDLLVLVILNRDLKSHPTVDLVIEFL